MNQNLKALVIENHSEPTETLREFTDWGLANGLFESVEYNCNSLHETPGTMLTAISHNDAIIVQSEFLYKDQLEMFLDYFANHETRRLTFFIWNLEESANRWIEGEDVKDFKDAALALDNLRTIVGKYQVYTMKGSNTWYVTLNRHRKFSSVLITRNSWKNGGLY